MSKRDQLERQARDVKGRASERVEELKEQAHELRLRAEEMLERAERLRERASDRVVDLSDKAAATAENFSEELHERAEEKVKDHEDEDKGGKKGIIALLLAAVAGVALFLKRKRERELDEALWEEPRSL